VATDAIGMGLNMDVDHVAFAGLAKFDGKRHRDLFSHEVGQIAGRAGRFRRDGTFGVTGGCPPMDDDLVQAVESHRFAPVEAAFWRNSALDFDSLPDLLRSLAAPAPREGLKASDEALDERALRRLAADPDLADRCRDRSALLRLWDACQTPDFRKITPDEHIGLVRILFDHLSGPAGVVPDGWMSEQHRQLDRLEGDIDALSTRLAGVRTLAYVANRPDWLAQAAQWREVTRALEDRLSDTLHEKLMARFVDRRTSVLMRSLGTGADLLAGVGADGMVTVEGQFVGRLQGVRFEPARGENALAAKALRAAAQKAVEPEIARRLGRLAAEPDEAFALEPTGDVLWRGEAAGVLASGDPFKPVVRLHGELGHPSARERAARRLEAFVAGEASARLARLKGLGEALGSGALKGLARGVAWRLSEAGGALARQEIEREVAQLSGAERRALRTLGVRFGRFAVHLDPSPHASGVAQAFAWRAAPDWRPGDKDLVRLPHALPAAPALGLRGRVRVGPLAVRVEALERLAARLNAGTVDGGEQLSEADREALGWSAGELREVMRALNYAPARKAGPGEPTTWRRRRAATAPEPAREAPNSPFAVLAALQAPPPRRRRSRPRTRAKGAHG
jgi:ATP-dependent RNA helicase SUPV3L1/SUV3